jgi:biopolymer transport protein ExbB
MIQIFVDGGPVMWPLLASALIAMAVAFERMITLSRIPKPAKAEQQLEEIEAALNQGGLEAAAQKVSKGKGILNYIFARLLKRYDSLLVEKRDLDKTRAALNKGESDSLTTFLSRQAEMSEIREELLITVDDSIRSYVTRFLPVMNTISSIATLMGLLGTITGMIGAFGAIAASGTGDPRVVAAGISEALITTATGLIIALPTVVVYRFIVTRAEDARTKVELYAISFSNSLLAHLETSENK